MKPLYQLLNEASDKQRIKEIKIFCEFLAADIIRQCELMTEYEEDLIIYYEIFQRIQTPDHVTDLKDELNRRLDIIKYMRIIRSDDSIVDHLKKEFKIKYEKYHT